MIDPVHPRPSQALPLFGVFGSISLATLQIGVNFEKNETVLTDTLFNHSPRTKLVRLAFDPGIESGIAQNHARVWHSQQSPF
jgi:hypothetical protein